MSIYKCVSLYKGVQVSKHELTYDFNCIPIFASICICMLVKEKRTHNAKAIKKPVQTEEYISLQASHLQGKSFPKSTMHEHTTKELFPLERL